MTRLPCLKGKELVRLLEKIGFELYELEAVTFFSGLRTEELPQSPYIPAKPLAPVCCGPFFGTWNCQWTNCFPAVNIHPHLAPSLETSESRFVEQVPVKFAVPKLG